MTAVSIIITNHNYEEYVSAAVDSALRQDHDDLEVLVVDDGSTDRSLDVIDRYRRTVEVIEQENRGQGSAFNAGFARCSGDVVIFLDADDVLYPAAAATAATISLEDQFVKLHWPLDEVDAQGAPRGMLVPGPGSELPVGDHRREVLRSGPGTMRFPPTSGNAWSRAFLEQVLPLDEHVFRIGADTLLFEVAPFCGPMARSLDPLGAYRVHHSNRWRHLTLAEQLSRELDFYEECMRVAAQLTGLVDDERTRSGWRAHGWWPRLARAVDTVRNVVPDGESFGLIDDAAWGLSELEHRRALPIPAGFDGRWAGTPASDVELAKALDDLCARSIRFVVVGWASAWWLDHYPTLRSRLGAPLVATEDVSIFTLESIERARVPRPPSTRGPRPI